MEDEDAELEEGEAKEALDPDTDFSYLDTRLEMLLGDCQKEFQGGNLSTEKLGSKYGGYGTFLPTQARVPSALADPHPTPLGVELGRPVGEVIAEPVKRAAGTSVQQARVKDDDVVSSFPDNKQVKLKIKLGRQAAATDEAKRKALYNGLGLGFDDESEDASLDDDGDNYSRSNVESPEPSPMSMIEMMTAPCPEGGLLSPLSDSTFEIIGAKETSSYMHKSGNFSTATSNAHSSGSKVDLNSPRGTGLGYRKVIGFETDKHTMDGRKGADLLAGSIGGRKSRRDTDADKVFVKEKQLKYGRKDVIRGEQLESLDEKGMEGLGKEEFDLVRDPFSKSSRKHLEITKPPTVNGQKEQEVTDGKGPGKAQASKIIDNKEFSRSKVAGKAQALKDSEVVYMTDNEKESHDKGLSLSEARKQGNGDSKYTPPVRIKENSKEGFKENQRKDVAGVKAKDLSRDTFKSGNNPTATKSTSRVAAGRKGTLHGHKSSKSAQEKKPFMKEVEKERISLPEPAASKEEEKVPAVLEAAPASLVVPQLVLDNWVACDKCEQWRLLMPQVNPDTLPKKWRCKMMDWLPGMNDCKFKEEETTAAVYTLLGYQIPALPVGTLPAAAAAAAPVAFQASTPAAEHVLDKWADEVDTKKSFLPKKGVARKLGGFGAKVAGSRGVDGVKSKNINDMGLDNSGDGTTMIDKNKPKAKEKVKRVNTNEGEDTRIKKKTPQEWERNLEASQWSKEIMDVEPIQGEKERVFLPSREIYGGGPGKRKKVGAFDDLDETPNPKMNKGGRARLQLDDPQVPSEEEYTETDKRANVKKSKREMSILKSKGVSHSGLQDSGTQDIDPVFRGLGENDGVLEKLREDRDQGRRSKALEKQSRSKEDGSDSEHRTWRKRRDNAFYDRPNQASPGKPAYGREDFNRSTSSKVSNSSSGSLKGMGSPLESTVSSSPLRVTNGNSELFDNRVLPDHNALGTDVLMQSSPDLKHVRAASRGSTLDEGEYRHPAVNHHTTRFGKQDSSCEGRDDGWYEEDRGVDHGHNHNHHLERHPHCSGDIEDVDGQQVRKKCNRERDSDRRRLDIRDNDHADHPDDDAKNRNTRDERCRPPRESVLETPGFWEDDLKPDGAKCAHRRDNASAQAYGARVGLSSKETNRESVRILPNARKDGAGIAVGPSDISKGPGVSSNTRAGGDKGLTLKREDMETGLPKTFVGELGTGSPAKKDKEQYAHAILTSNNYLKNAKDLKHSADRLKNADETESTNLYLQSALEFLQSAAILESVQAESITNNYRDLYRDTAGLCEFCGNQYKRRGDLRATALAYTCAAVARARLMMSKKSSFANDCKEFQSAAQLTSGPHMPSNGESPSSSSASDVDNFNKHHGIIPGNKASLGKAAIVSPQVPSGASGVTSLNIPARLRPVATRFLRDAHDMNVLLDSWQRAAEATAKAEASKDIQGMAAVKQVGELGGFGDIDGVVRLVKVAMDAIGH